MKKNIFIALFLALCVLVAAPAHAKLNIAATTTDIEALVRAVAGNQVDVFAVAKGTQDPHQIEAKPSFMVKFHNADLVISHGLELESAWLEPLIQGSRNSKIHSGTKGFLELAKDLDPIEVAHGAVSRAEGDVHPEGNPHFQLDPIRLGSAAILIADRLGELDTSHRVEFQDRAKKFQSMMVEKTKDWQKRIEKSGVKEIVTYHKGFSYFCNRFQLKCSLQLEPKPGIPPTASHLLELIDAMRTKKITTVFIENYFDGSVGDKIKQSIPSAKVQQVPVSVQGMPGIQTNDALMEYLVHAAETNQ